MGNLEAEEGKGVGHMTETPKLWGGGSLRQAIDYCIDASGLLARIRIINSDWIEETIDDGVEI